MPIVSSSWFMRGMPSVVTFSTWVSPRSNRARAVRGRDEADLGVERADVGRVRAVDADALLDDPLADELLRERADRGLDLALAAFELAGEQLADDLVGRLVERGVALGLCRRDGVGLGDDLGADSGDALVDVVGVVDEELVGDRRLAAGLHELALQLDRLADPGLGGLETLRRRPLRSPSGRRLRSTARRARCRRPRPS
jgi:hypothetical protein